MKMGFNNSQPSSVETNRRRFLYTTAGVVTLCGVGCTQTVTADSESEILYENNFETYSIGDVPSEFELAGNDDQGVVDEPVAVGNRAYRMSGSHGGCWEALARFRFSVESQMRIKGQYRLVAGEEGCHSDRGDIRLKDEIGTSWSTGDGPKLLDFGSDGVVRTAGTEVGEYSEKEWITFEIIYQRDSKAGEVTHQCRINDGEWVSATRDEHSAEDDLVGLQLASGDFTVIWDELIIERYVDEPATFKISNVSPDGETITESDTVTVTADIENTGGEHGNQTVEFRLDTDTSGMLEEDETVDTRTVELDADSSTDVSFEVDTSTLLDETGTYTHGVFSDDDSATASIIVGDGSGEFSKYTDDEGYVDSEGLLDAGADFRAGEIDESTLSEVTSAFRSGEPLS